MLNMKHDISPIGRIAWSKFLYFFQIIQLSMIK